MAAGTVISGGFPGRVAQEVQPNPKCNGCLHFDGQAGRTGACTIGLRPWLCGEGDAADIGYAPISRGAGAYLPGMDNHSVQAPHVDDQEVSDLYGARSTRGVQFQQVSLGEEHIHFVKSMVAQHTEVQKTMCRLCKSAGTIGTTHSNLAPQVCTCEPIAARDIAKALVSRLSNLARAVIDVDDATAFVYDVAQAGFKASAMEKGTFYQQHGKYEVSPSGKGQHHVDFHPRGGGAPARVGTFGSHREARHAAERHHTRFASGTGADNAAPSATSEEKTTSHKKPKSTQTPPGLPSMKDAVSVKGEAPRHPHDLKVGDLVTHSSSTGFHHPDPKVAATHGSIAQVDSIKNHPHSGEPSIQVRYHDSSGKMSKRHLLSGYDSSRHPTTEDMQHHSKTLKRHFNAKAKIENAEKSLVLTAEVNDGIEKSLRWSHKTPGQASTSHGKYHVTANEGGGHTVTYSHKDSGKSYSKTFASHREALGAVTEHHLKNRPPPKKRAPKDPAAAKPKAEAAGGCPPCP